MIDLVVGRANVTDTLILVLRSTSTSEDLQNVENAEIDKGTFARVVHLRAFDNDGVGGQVDTPGKSRGTAEDLGRV